MSKPRIAAWIAGTTLLLSSGVALAQTEPLEPTVEPAAAEVEDAPEPEESVTEEESSEAAEVAEVQEVEAVEPAEELDDASAEEETDEAKDNHGAVVSEAAKNHEFDEACGNHGAYVSEVAKGGDPAAPACAEDDATGEAVEAAGDDTDESPKATSKGASADKGKAKGAKASGGKAAKGGR